MRIQHVGRVGRVQVRCPLVENGFEMLVDVRAEEEPPAAGGSHWPLEDEVEGGPD